MPKGDPKPQTIASEKYQKKMGYIAKSYKIRKEISDAFAEACDKSGVSQASQITRMMQEYIDSHKK